MRVCSVSAMATASVWLLVAVLAILPTFGNCKDKKKAQPIKEDLQYISCEVCEKAIHEVYWISMLTRERLPYKKLEEIHVVEAIESVCT
jgi:hypothetical protein